MSFLHNESKLLTIPLKQSKQKRNKANKEKLKEYQKVYQEANREKIKERRKAQKPVLKKLCLYCGKEIITTSNVQLFCSEMCRTKYHN